MEKPERDELKERLESLIGGRLGTTHPLYRHLHDLFADYDALEDQHRLCGTRIAAQKGIAQGLRKRLTFGDLAARILAQDMKALEAKLAAETDRCVKVVSRHLGAIIGEGLNKDGQAVGEAWNDLEDAMREGE